MLNLNDMANICRTISDQREANGAKISHNLLKAAAGELIEASEKKAWVDMLADGRWPKSGMKTTLEEHHKVLDEYADELMDGLFCILVECNRNGIDVEKALRLNIKKNEKRALKKGDKL